MITIISPAKTMKFDDNHREIPASKPLFIDEAEELVKELRKYSAFELGSLMKISDDIAHENHIRFLNWTREHNSYNSVQALLAYGGAVYQSLYPHDFEDEDMEFAQKHLRILSGLYGVIRPGDLIQPYRLEMGFKFKNSKVKDVYSFWKRKLTGQMNMELDNQGEGILINLASNEYFTALDKNKLQARIITPVFKEHKNGTYRVIAISAKKARGLIARYIIKNRINNPELLKDFKDGGYSFNEEMSKENEWVFINMGSKNNPV